MIYQRTKYHLASAVHKWEAKYSFFCYFTL